MNYRDETPIRSILNFLVLCVVLFGVFTSICNLWVYDFHTVLVKLLVTDSDVEVFI